MTAATPYAAAEGLDVESLLRADLAAAQPQNSTHYEFVNVIDRRARAALERECEAVASAHEGTRNNTLNVASFNLGQLVAGGLLDVALVRAQLHTAANQCGLPSREAHAAIESGLRGGHKHPRQRPESHPVRTQPPRDASAPRPPYQVLSESIAQALKPVGQRLSTGIATLDHATRGGLPLGRLVMLLGAPGAAKTTLACWWLDSFERQGCAGLYVATDEPSEGIITRLGQLDGWSREGLESDCEAGAAQRAGFERGAQGKPIAVVDLDADERLSSIEDAEAALLHLAGDRPRVMIVDSLQTARCRAAEACDSQRERIDTKIATLKAIAKRGTLVIVISEMARGAYRSGDRSQDTSALAAGKESGAIEYGAALLIGLRSVKGEQGLVDVEVAKNRLGGSKPEFRIRLDFERASFSEVALPAAEEARTSARTAQAESDARELTQVLLVSPGLGARDMRAEARAQLGWGTARLDAALACLRHGQDGYRAVNRGSDRAAEWHIEAVTEDV